MIRALICDLYGTLLQVTPPESPPTWDGLWRDALGMAPVMGEFEFSSRCRSEIEAVHRAKRERGIRFPEVDWLDILSAAIGHQPREVLGRFAMVDAARQRNTMLMPGAAEVLAEARRRGMVCGLCSNAQAYTLSELHTTGADLAFDPDFIFLSFQHGFAKPAPEVFAWLAGRLTRRGIRSDEILMVGDRLDNDIAPASAAGWNTWLLTPHESERSGKGTWRQLGGWLFGNAPSADTHDQAAPDE
ncbi:MAG: HAD family hydrolase [Verrucomicrobiales bacterium]|nr:HAD family hydrolase [Verrucomicrobiales bacterium]